MLYLLLESAARTAPAFAALPGIPLPWTGAGFYFFDTVFLYVLNFASNQRYCIHGVDLGFVSAEFVLPP